MSVDMAKVEVVTLKRRNEDLDTLFKRIYEDMVSGRLSAERFDKLSTEYEEEQRQVKQTIVELQTLIDSGEQSEFDLQEFLRNVRKYTDPKELTSELLNDLVDRIVIHAPDKSCGKRRQKIEIYYKAAGIINIHSDDCIAECVVEAYVFARQYLNIEFVKSLQRRPPSEDDIVDREGAVQVRDANFLIALMESVDKAKFSDNNPPT